MRYDRIVYFQKITKGEYIPRTGNYAADTVDEFPVFANVTDSSTDTLNLVYGGLKEGSLTIRLQNVYTDEIDFVRVGDKKYRIDQERRLRTKHSLVVSEVQ